MARESASTTTAKNAEEPTYMASIRIVVAGAVLALAAAFLFQAGSWPVAIFAFFLSLALNRLLTTWLAGSFDPLKLLAVPPSALPEAARDHFDRHTPEMEQLGYRSLGDFSCKRRTTHFSRFFINLDGTIFGELTHLSMPLTKLQTCAFFSITDSLTYIETGNLKVPADKPHPRFVLRGIEGASLPQLLHEHQELIAEHSEDTPAPISFRNDELDVVCLYGQKMLYDSLIAQKLATSNPYENVTLGSEEEATQPS